MNNDMVSPAASSAIPRQSSTAAQSSAAPTLSAAAPRRRTALAALSTAAVLAVGACSGATGASGGDFSVQDLFAELPMVEDGGLIAAGDLEAATAAAGLDRPADAGADGANEWLLGLTRQPDTGVFVPVPGDFLNSFGQPGGDELGWDLSDVHTFAHHEGPPSRTVLVTGEFDADTLAADLHDAGEGVYSAGSGQDFEVDLAGRTALRPTGAALRLAQDGNRIMVSAQEQVVRDWVQGEQGSTLADHEAVMDLAAALDDRGVYSAALSVQAAPLQGLTPEHMAVLEQWAVQEPFTTVGVGWAMDSEEPVVRAAYHFGTAEAAERGADQVQRLWQEGTSADGRPLTDRFALQQVDTDGAVVIADLHLAGGGAAPHPFHMLMTQDTPFGYLP